MEGFCMRRLRFFLAVAAVAAVTALVLTPAMVEARAGGGNSQGSRGSHTNSAPPATSTAPGGAQQMQRTATPPSTPAAAPAAAAKGGFMGGLAGGLLMGGLFGALLGGSLLGAGFAGFLGVLLQMALIGGAVWLVMRLFRRPRLATAGGPAMFTGHAPATGHTPATGAAPLNLAGGGAPSGPPVHITPADFSAFEQNLKAVQAAYSTQSLPEMQRLATLEMLTYFETEFGQQSSRGVRNMVSDVKLLQGDLAEAWSEQGREYATVAMRFGLIDITRDATGRVVDGNPTQP
ncbi:MAG: Tim44 domain-containing protein, partial [Acetobacteraceae bacterium]|nr:Tim44 domain-containing protein [Acetobacteraceae bacterium]